MCPRTAGRSKKLRNKGAWQKLAPDFRVSAMAFSAWAAPEKIFPVM